MLASPRLYLDIFFQIYGLKGHLHVRFFDSTNKNLLFKRNESLHVVNCVFFKLFAKRTIEIKHLRNKLECFSKCQAHKTLPTVSETGVRVSLSLAKEAQ
jgi:hypothetical protein